MSPLLKKWKKHLLSLRKHKVNVFLDMDGVLVDFDGTVKATLMRNYGQNADKIHPRSSSKRKRLQNFQKLGLSSKEVGALYDSVNKKHKFGLPYDEKDQILRNYFYALLSKNHKLWFEMKKLHNSTGLIKNAFKYGNNVFILSAPIDKESERAKKDWIATNFPSIAPQNIFLAVDKGAKLFDLVNRGTVDLDDINILIDDRPSFIKSFRAAGGKAIEYDPDTLNDAIDELKALINN
jgi:5'(3')-deoxyribonucleotidase